jgi:hypothetical protein
LRRSTIGAERFHGRVRDGIGCVSLARATRSSKHMAPKAPSFCDQTEFVLMKIDKTLVTISPLRVVRQASLTGY